MLPVPNVDIIGNDAEFLMYLFTYLFDVMDLMLMIIRAFLAFFIGVALLLYSVMGIALFKLAKQQGYAKPWLSWIPIIQVFMIPVLTENKVHKRIRGQFTRIFGAVFVVSVLLAGMTMHVCWLFLPEVLLIYGFYMMAMQYSKQSTLHLAEAIVCLGLSIPFQLFCFSYREPL